MDSEQLDSFEETELLSLKERILLMQKGKSENAVGNAPVFKRVHSISDSEESDSNGKHSDNEYDLPPLASSLFNKKTQNSPHNQNAQNSSFNQKIPEVFILSDSEDEIKELCTVSENLKSDKDYVSKLTEKKFDDVEVGVEVINKVHKKSKTSISKPIKDNEVAKQEKLRIREEKKREKELEKAIKMSEKELQKCKKPDECLKAMKVIIDHNLILQSDSQDIFNALEEGNVKYSIEENPVNFSVAWCKTVFNVTIENNQVLKEEREEFENELIVLIPNDEFIKMSYAYTQKSKGKDTHEMVLSDYILNITSIFGQMKITCVILGLDKYIRLIKGTETHDSELKKIVKQVSKTVIEEALIEVQLQTAVNFIFVENMRELGDLLFRFTKAIAEAPQKREKQMQKDLAFSWYADADTSCPVKLNKERSSFFKLWKQQLQQFQNVSQETAEAIARVYSSPESLIKAYRQCASTNEAEKLLQDIVVRRNYGPLGTNRRIGPELSYKIYLFFTTKDGNQILQR